MIRGATEPRCAVSDRLDLWSRERPDQRVDRELAVASVGRPQPRGGAFAVLHAHLRDPPRGLIRQGGGPTQGVEHRLGRAGRLRPPVRGPERPDAPRAQDERDDDGRDRAGDPAAPAAHPAPGAHVDLPQGGQRGRRPLAASAVDAGTQQQDSPGEVLGQPRLLTDEHAAVVDVDRHLGAARLVPLPGGRAAQPVRAVDGDEREGGDRQTRGAGEPPHDELRAVQLHGVHHRRVPGRRDREGADVRGDPEQREQVSGPLRQRVAAADEAGQAEQGDADEHQPRTHERHDPPGVGGAHPSREDPGAARGAVEQLPRVGQPRGRRPHDGIAGRGRPMPVRLPPIERRPGAGAGGLGARVAAVLSW